MTDWRARVLEAVDGDAEEMVGLLARLVRIPGITGSAQENDAQAEMASRLTAAGLDVDHWRISLPELLAAPDFPGWEVRRTEAWGLVGRLPGQGTGPDLMLNGHIDVVPPGDAAAWTGDPFAGRIVGGLADGTLYGRGACDMKGGLVAALWAVRALQHTGVPLGGDVLLASVQGEEDGGLGTFATLRRGWRADACVIPEPTSLDLVPAAAGALTFRLSVPGHAAHASRRTSGVSAIEKFWPVWNALAELERRRNVNVDPLMDRWSIAYPLSIGRVYAGDWASSVPDLLVAEGRLGVALDEPVEAGRAALEETVRRVCDDDPWLRDNPVVVDWYGGEFGPGRLPPDSDLLERVRAAHAGVTGTPQRTWGAPYGSDLRLMSGIGGVPTMHYGPGNAALAHGPDECVSLAEVATAARALAVLALDFCGVR